jgi:hypothetical protein
MDVGTHSPVTNILLNNRGVVFAYVVLNCTLFWLNSAMWHPIPKQKAALLSHCEIILLQ